MTESFHLSIAVLAAGRSARFGDIDKLAVPLRGKMLGNHAVDTLSQLAADHKWVIAAGHGHDCAQGWREAGFELVVNPDAADGMGASAAVAARLAMDRGADALLICLADMPLVPRSHYQAIIDAARGLGEDGIVASSTGKARMPPACFRKARFARLADLHGDCGARALLHDAIVVECAPHWLIDVDRPDDLDLL